MALSENTSEQVKFLHKKAAWLLKRKLSDENIIASMHKEGITESYAEMIIENIKADMHDRRNAWRFLLLGIFVITGGFLINLLSYEFFVRVHSLFF